MKLKKYVGDTMPEVMQQIRAELGPDAVILNTKEIQHGGFFGLFTKKKLEVVAALDPEPIQPNNEQQHKRDNVSNEQQINAKQNKDAVVLQEIQYLKKIIHSLVKSDVEIDPQYMVAYNYLTDQEVNEELAQQIIDQAINNSEQTDQLSQTKIVDTVQKEIERSLAQRLQERKRATEGIIHFVGPTGVGKTTTLAKVAANSILQENKKVALITTDTYRIAAIDQLKTYAKILHVPVEVAYTKEDYVRALKKFSTYDLIYVDTAGRNFRQNEYLNDLKDMIDLNSHTKTYLVLSLTAKKNDVIDIFNEFKQLQIKDVIFTKIDETRQYGNILNIVLYNDVNVAYLTNGQDVPNDLLLPTPNKLSHLIMGDYFNE